jgi:hypothetical protein
MYIKTVHSFHASCKTTVIRAVYSPHRDKGLHIHTFKALQGPFLFQLFLDRETTVWRRTHDTPALSHQLAQQAGKLADHTLMLCTLQAALSR